MDHVVVLCGGRSAEHDISLLSASSILNHLDRSKHRISVLGVQKDGSIYSAGQIADKLELQKPDGVHFLSGQNWFGLLTDLTPPADIVFPVLHGPFGEDGTVQGALEILDTAYVGSGVMGSALAMNKICSKEILQWSDLPTLPWISFSQPRWRDNSDTILNRIEGQLDYPIFVKPANLGSSIGINKSKQRRDLASHIEVALQYDDYVLCEQGIEAREIELSVLGNDHPEVSVAGEVVPSSEFYDYEAKYIDEESQLLIPAPLSEDQAQQAQQWALAAFGALQLEGMARIDCLLETNTGKFWINEANTIPGFTRISMYPRLWEASGLSYGCLLDRLIELGLERHRRRGRLSVER